MQCCNNSIGCVQNSQGDDERGLYLNIEELKIMNDFVRIIDRIARIINFLKH